MNITQRTTKWYVSLSASILVAMVLMGCSAVDKVRYAIDPCYVPAGAAADGAALAKVTTWNDLNANGKIDADEPPLRWVNFLVGEYNFELPLTDSKGMGSSYEFMPGCACYCWKGKSVTVRVPLGFRATTPTEQPLTGNDLMYNFGFVREGVAPIDFPNEPDWYQAFLNMGFDLTQFRCDETHNHLYMTVDVSPVADLKKFYDDLFATIYILEYRHHIKIDDFTITLIPAITTVNCLMSVVDDKLGKISAQDIANQYCH